MQAHNESSFGPKKEEILSPVTAGMPWEGSGLSEGGQTRQAPSHLVHRASRRSRPHPQRDQEGGCQGPGEDRWEVPAQGHGVLVVSQSWAPDCCTVTMRQASCAASWKGAENRSQMLSPPKQP